MDCLQAFLFFPLNENSGCEIVDTTTTTKNLGGGALWMFLIKKNLRGLKYSEDDDDDDNLNGVVRKSTEWRA